MDKYKNMGVFDAGTVRSSSSTPAATGGRFRTMDAQAVASGGAFLQSELEKRDPLVREPLTSVTYPRDIPIRVGGGWVDYVSAMNVGYGVTGGSEDGIVHAGGANGIPMVQADFGQELYKAHAVSVGLRVMWLDMQKNNLTGRNYDSLLKDGVRLTYDKHMDCNTYVGIKKYGTTGTLNNPNVPATNAADNGTGSTRWKDKTPDQILQDVNDAILMVWSACANDLSAIPNHITMPYEQYNSLATRRVSELAEKTILDFLMENNVAKKNGSNLVIGGVNWCKGAGVGGTDRMAVYRNEERFIAMDELAPLNRAMTSPNTENVCYDTAYMANVSEVQIFYDQSMMYVDGI